MLDPAVHLVEGPQPRVACNQCGILLYGRERWSLMQAGREVSPLCAECYVRLRAKEGHDHVSYT